MREALPLTKRTLSLWCLVDSSFPVFLAKALASFLIWSTAFSCHPPKEGDEGYTFPFTSLKGGSAFVIEGLGEGMARRKGTPPLKKIQKYFSYSNSFKQVENCPPPTPQKTHKFNQQKNV